MTPSEKAERSRQLLADPVLVEAFGDIRMALVARLEAAGVSDTELQHEIALMLQLLKRLRTQLETYCQDEIVEKHRKKHDSFIERMRERIA